MAKSQIGSLYIALSANASAFEKTLDGAQKRLTSFAAKVASPVAYGARIGSIMAGAVAGPAGIAASAAGTVAKIFDPMSAHLFNPEKFQDAMEGVVARTVDLAREAKKLDFTPQFFASLKMAAGPDADAAITAVKKLERVIGQATAGGDKELKHGETNKDKLSKWGLNADELSKMNPEEAFLKVAKRYTDLKDHVAQAAMGFDLFGKGAAESGEAIKKFAADTEKYIAKIKELGLYNPDQVHLAQAQRELEKQYKRRTEAVDARAFERYGAGYMQGRQEMYESPFFSDKWKKGASRTLTSIGVGLQNLFGMDARVQDYGYQPEAVTAAVAAREKEAAGPNAAELKIQKSKADTVVATKSLIEELDKETAAIYGESDANKVAAAASREYQTAEGKRELDAALRRKELAKPTKEMDDMLDKLREQNHYWGESADQVKVYQAALKGVDATKIADVTKELREQDGLKLKDDTATPLEKFSKEADKLKKLRDEGVIDGGLFGRGLAKAFGGLGTGSEQIRLAPSALKGSAEDAHIQNMQWAEREQHKRTPEEIAADILLEAKMAAVRQERQTAAAEALLDMAAQNGIAIFPENG